MINEEMNTLNQEQIEQTREVLEQLDISQI